MYRNEPTFLSRVRSRVSNRTVLGVPTLSGTTPAIDGIQDCFLLRGRKLKYINITFYELHSSRVNQRKGNLNSKKLTANQNSSVAYISEVVKLMAIGRKSIVQAL